MPVHAVGKVAQLFAGQGIDAAHPARRTPRRSRRPRAAGELDGGLVFANLVETDQVYGHRKDVEGFHGALREIDAAVGGVARAAGPEGDLLVLTADHGCDPDHARHRPHPRARAAARRFAGHGGRRHDGPLADVGASFLRWLDRRRGGLPGTPFVP